MARKQSMSSLLGTMRYRSDYPNQMHQLMVTISRHLELLSTGYFKHQQKPLSISWERLERGDLDKDHVIHFVIRDHYSGFFYAETHPLSKMISLEGFLHHAWAAKKNYPFFGIPRNLMVQKHILDFFPSIKNFFRNSPGLHTQLSSSGFEAGISSVKYWEQRFIHRVVYGIPLIQNPVPYSSLLNQYIFLNSQILGAHFGGGSETLEKYVTGFHLTPKDYTSTTVPNSFEQFSELFSSPSMPKFSNALVNQIYHADLTNELTEQESYGKIEFKNPKQDHIDNINLKEEIKNRPGFRSIITKDKGRYYVVYNAKEYGIKNPPKPWVIICKSHGTKEYHRVIGEALSAARNSRSEWCGECKTEWEEIVRRARERLGMRQQEY